MPGLEVARNRVDVADVQRQRPSVEQEAHVVERLTARECAIFTTVHLPVGLPFGREMILAIAPAGELLLILHEATGEEPIGVDPRLEAVVDAGKEYASGDLEPRMQGVETADALLSQHLEGARADFAPLEPQLVFRLLAGGDAAHSHPNDRGRRRLGRALARDEALRVRRRRDGERRGESHR